jgi:hypothetical protein
MTLASAQNKIRRAQGISLADKNAIKNALQELNDGLQAAITPGSAIADASEAHALNATFSDTEVEAALDALGAKINAVILALETAGILAA